MKEQYDLIAKKDMISALTGLAADCIRVFSGKQDHYRNRIDFAFHEKGLGLKEKGKWYEVYDVRHSDLANQKINILLQQVRKEICGHRDFDLYRIKEHTGTFKFAVIRATNLSSSVTFILNREAQDLKAGIKLIKDVQGNIGAENIIIGYSTKEGATSISDDIEVIKGSKYLKERIGDKVFSFHSQGFFQVNEEIASIMVGYVREILSEKGNNVLADLYGGVGLLGVSCADLFNEVFIVEAYEDSILLAEKNALFNGVRNIRTFNLDAKRMDLVKIDASKDFKVILDPPRSGMTAKAIKKILKMRASKIIYVSCNPKKFSQEIEKFTNRGYDIKSCAIFDMFPGTKHIEIVAEFERDESEF